MIVLQKEVDNYFYDMTFPTAWSAIERKVNVEMATRLHKAVVKRVKNAIPPRSTFYGIWNLTSKPVSETFYQVYYKGR